MELLGYLELDLYMVIEDNDETNAIKLCKADGIRLMLKLSDQCNDETVHLVYLPSDQLILKAREERHIRLQGNILVVGHGVHMGDIGPLIEQINFKVVDDIDAELTELEIYAMNQLSMGTTKYPYDMSMLSYIPAPCNIDLDLAFPSIMVTRKQLAAYSHKPKGVKRCYKTQKR